MMQGTNHVRILSEVSVDCSLDSPRTGVTSFSPMSWKLFLVL